MALLPTIKQLATDLLTRFGRDITIRRVTTTTTETPKTTQIPTTTIDPADEIEADFLLAEKDIYVPADKFGVWVVPPLVAGKDELEMVVDAIDEALLIADAAVEDG